jgi:hypothetical protein
MSHAFTDILKLIADGDLVNQATINRVLRDLISNDRFLYDLINSINQGSTVMAREVSIDSQVRVGQPVYYNTANNQFEQGLAQASVSGTSLLLSESALVVGICYKKHNSTLADILLFGYSTVDLTESAGANAPEGLYYLSGAQAGKLVQQEPPVSVPVLIHLGDNQVFLRPAYTDLFTAHQHHSVPLACVPAGTPLLTGDNWSITSPDSNIEGWLPAGHAVFNGRAPAGAKFGYNLSASSLADAWPPLPLSGASLEWSRGDDPYVGGTAVPLGFDGLAIIDQFGIWWMVDCDTFIPWALDQQTTTTIADCPPVWAMTMTLHYTRLKFQTSRTVVTSLRSLSDALVVECENVGESATGNVTIDLDLGFLLDADTDTPGSTVLKGLSGNTFLRGPVVEAIKPGASNVTITSNLPVGGDGYYQGKLVVNVRQNAMGGELPVYSIRLHGATEEDYAGTLAVGFPSDKDADYSADISIPADIGYASVKLKLRFTLLARAAGDLPALTLVYRLIPPAALPTALPTSDSALTLDIASLPTMAEDEYIEILSDEITAVPGSILLFNLARAAQGGDGFPGEVHVLRQVGLITGGT